jgi:hypothetical protein
VRIKQFKLDESSPTSGIRLVIGSGVLKLVTSNLSLPLNPKKYFTDEGKKLKFETGVVAGINAALKQFNIQKEITQYSEIGPLIKSYRDVVEAFTEGSMDATAAITNLKSDQGNLFPGVGLSLEAGSILGEKTKGAFAREVEFQCECESLDITPVIE